MNSELQGTVGEHKLKSFGAHLKENKLFIIHSNEIDNEIGMQAPILTRKN